MLYDGLLSLSFMVLFAQSAQPIHLRLTKPAPTQDFAILFAVVVHKALLPI